jgi:hypothetical protein
VRLVEWSQNLRPFRCRVGVLEGAEGDDVLVRYGEVVIQVPAEWVERVED